MFYSYNLLSHKKGKFAIIWLAATRGEKFLTKKDIYPVDLSATCDEIVSYINCNLKDRLSLYLSAQLTVGICRVYRKKATYILVELQDLYTKSLRSFQPDLMIITSIKKGKEKATGEKGKQGPHDSFSSRIDLHPCDQIPETREDFGQLVMPFGIDELEKRRGGDLLPFLDDWVMSQLPSGDTIIDASGDKSSSVLRDSNQARPEDITMREDQLSANHLLEGSILSEQSAVVAGGGQGIEELQLAPMNLDFFQPAEELPPQPDRRSTRRRAAAESDSQPKSDEDPAAKRPRRASVTVHVVQVEAEVHARPDERREVPQPARQQQEQKQQPTGPQLDSIAEEAPPRTDQMDQQMIDSIQLFEDAQPTGLSAAEQAAASNLFDESLLGPTQAGMVRETPEEQQGRQIDEGRIYDPLFSEEVQQTADQPAVAAATTGDVVPVDVPTERVQVVAEVTEPPRSHRSSVERLLRHPAERRPRGGRRRRARRLVVDRVTALTRENIRAQLAADGRGLMAEVAFAPTRVLPSADWLLGHPGERNLGSVLNQFWRERAVLCAQGLTYEEREQQQQQQNQQQQQQQEDQQLQDPQQQRAPGEDSVRVHELSSISEIERRRGASDKSNLIQSVLGATDVSILPATAGSSLLADASGLAATSHQQSGTATGQKTMTEVMELPPEQVKEPQEEQQPQPQVDSRIEQEIQMLLEQPPPQQQTELELLMEQQPPPPQEQEQRQQPEPEKLQQDAEVPPVIFEEENDVWRIRKAFPSQLEAKRSIRRYYYPTRTVA